MAFHQKDSHVIVILQDLIIYIIYFINIFVFREFKILARLLRVN